MLKLRPFRSALALSGLTVLACQPQITAPAPAVAPAVARIPLAKLLEAVQQENARMVDIHGTSQGAGSLLGQLNGKLQSHAYFRRIPTDPALEALDAQMRQLAAEKQLLVTRVEHHQVPPPAPLPAVQLQPGQRWEPELAQLRGVVEVSLDLQGAQKDVAGFIDALPQSVERLLVVTGAAPIAGGVRLMAEAYYERSLPAPQIDIRWPTLEERLTAAGWDPQDVKLLADPMRAELNKEVELGRQRLPAVRHALQVSADFPRWLLRTRFFEDRANAALSVHGQQLLTQQH